jgi:hypothetical protein
MELAGCLPVGALSVAGSGRDEGKQVMMFLVIGCFRGECMVGLKLRKVSVWWDLRMEWGDDGDGIRRIENLSLCSLWICREFSIS